MTDYGSKQTLTRGGFNSAVTDFKNEWVTANAAGQVGHRTERALEFVLARLGITVEAESVTPADGLGTLEEHRPIIAREVIDYVWEEAENMFEAYKRFGVSLDD